MAKNASAVKTNLSQEAIPESPKPSTSSKFSPKKDVSRSPNIAPNPNPDKVTDEEETKTRLLPGNPTEKSATRGSSATRSTGSNGPMTNGKPKAIVTTKPPPRAGPVPSLKPVTKALKSPNTAKPATSTAKATTHAPSLAPQKKAAAPTSSKEHDAPKKTTAPAAAKAPATSGKKPAPIDLPASSGTGFVKPKPKSPTRPIKLPASLTAPTASYASKHGSGAASHPPRQSLSRASGNGQHLNVAPTMHRSPSRASIASTGITTNTKPLKRQSSTISRPRPSLGPPPKQTARDHPVAKKEAHVDDSFLARMMRPTQASSSKTAEKAPVTPPRKQSTPVTAHKKPVAKDAETSAKKAVAKIQSSTNKVKAAVETIKPADKEAPTAKEVAPVVAQAETAEVAIAAAKTTTETAATPEVEKAEQAVLAEPAVIEPATTEVSKEESKEEAQEVPVDESPRPTTTVPAITEDPAKVEDIEDVVQEAVEEPVEQKAEEPAVEPAVAVEEPQETEEAQSAPEAKDEVAPVETGIAVAEEPKVEEVKVEEAQAEEAKVEEQPKTPEPEADKEEEEAKAEEPKVESPKIEVTKAEDDAQAPEVEAEVSVEDA
ncbi:hypothetical protein F4819DRAFT_462052 [Hypoxylon fuscum]|nr:hypothetical protein F4819DRAFT_462052 [Hypoxylon fuscum]